MALKLVSIEADRDGQQMLEAERWGAKLQEEFCRESRYVPAVYEHGTHGPYFFIAMEYLDGRNLSEVIGEGRCRPTRAVHDRDAALRVPGGRGQPSSARSTAARSISLLHGDLKPRNIRVLDGDEIKVFDFGIAKALSLSRKVTRNDFGSIAYLSPERLESGDIDAQAEFWAVGVLLYEMVSGVQPFRAADTRRLEQRIRARRAAGAARRRVPRRPPGDHRQAARAGRGRPLQQRDRDSRRSAACRGRRADPGRARGLARSRGTTSRRRGGRTGHDSPGDDEVTRRTVRRCARDSSAAAPRSDHARGRARACTPADAPAARCLRPRKRAACAGSCARR